MENYTCESLSASIQRNLDALPANLSRRCIYKVPKSLREVNEEAYTPKYVSIGPLHYKNDNLCAMEVHKLKYLKSFKNACQNPDILSYCLQIVMDNETQLRASYASSTIHITSEEYTEMIFMDSVFIIELFRRYFYPFLRDDDNYICGIPYMLSAIKRDIILMENQIPLFILKELYWAAFKPQSSFGIPYFTDLVCTFFDISERDIPIDATTNETKCSHLLDLHRSCFLPDETSNDKYGNFIVFPTATSLYEAGIEFKVAENGASGWINVDFDSVKGILTIPKLQVTHKTDSYLRNLLAFEQCHYIQHSSSWVSDYLLFLDCLIKTPEDVQIFVKASIVENCLASDKDVSDLVSSLRKNVPLTHPYYYGGISDQLNVHYNKTWSRRRYFKGSLALISSVLLTLIVIKNR